MPFTLIIVTASYVYSGQTFSDQETCLHAASYLAAEQASVTVGAPVALTAYCVPTERA